MTILFSAKKEFSVSLKKQIISFSYLISIRILLITVNISIFIFISFWSYSTIFGTIRIKESIHLCYS
ncbi:hypothetical protein D352_00619 [Enterococcus faecium LA4B-2]|nr:hypothetical protein D352_00619 [Enterococcus faecium LA4B-2]